MAIVTGDRYLDLLARFVEEHAGALLDGSLVLKLNPVGLHYVQTRLEALHELERLRTGAPVDYLRAYIADLGDHRALEQLSRVLGFLPAVKVVSVLPRPARDPSPITLLPFGRLRSLELRGCNLSSSAARGLLELRPILEKLICHNSAEALRHIFAERMVEIQDTQVWTRLATIFCVYNGMLLMDESLQLLPAVQLLDLSRNRFAKVANLQRCLKLKYLDLGFNRLRTISPFNEVKASITKLVLRNNALIALDGIQSLVTLEALDLSYNMISNFNEIELLSPLVSLEILCLEGNPIAFASFYREQVLSFFPDPGKIQLDRRKISQSENWIVSVIVSKRLKKWSGHGLYAPAEHATASQTGEQSTANDLLTQTMTDTGVLAPKAKKKMSRLASIQDAQPQRLLGVEGSEQDGSSQFHGFCSNSVDAEEKVDEVAHDKTLELMRRDKTLRQKGSRMWLQELKGLLEENDSQSRQDMLEFTTEERYEVLDLKIWQMHKRGSRRCLRQHQKFAKLVTPKLSNGDKRSEISDKHAGGENNILTGWSHDCAHDDGSEILEMVDDIKYSFGHDDVAATLSPGPSFGVTVPEPTDVPSSDGQKDSRLSFGRSTSTCREANGRGENTQIGFGYVADEEQTSVDDSFGSQRIIDEMAESHVSSGNPTSPPHYHEDLLHKRQNLEEELLRFSFDSGCVPSSSDSETSGDSGLLQELSSSSPVDSPNTVDELRRPAIAFSFCKARTEQTQHLNGEADRELIAEHMETIIDQPNESANTVDLNDQSGTNLLGTNTSLMVQSCPILLKDDATSACGTGHLNLACTDDICVHAGGGGISPGKHVKPRPKKKGKQIQRIVTLEYESSNHDLHHIDGIDLGQDATDSNENNKAAYSNTCQIHTSLLQGGDSSNPVLGDTFATGNCSGIKKVGPTPKIPQFTQIDKFILCGNGHLKDPVEEFFQRHIADSEEICLHYLRCSCICLWEVCPEERDIFLLSSSENKLYMLFRSRRQFHSFPKSDFVLSVLASHNLKDLKKVIVGLGLQALRVDIGHGALYLFVTRDVNSSREILDMLSIPIEGDQKPDFLLESWEQTQLRMFDEFVHGSVGANIRMYTMLFYYCEGLTENIWAARSLFLTTKQAFLCIENLQHFGASSKDLTASKETYFTIEAWANAFDLIEVEVGPRNGGYLTLAFHKVRTRGHARHGRDRESSSLNVWKFKGVKEETLSKLVALLHASYMEATMQCLPVKTVL